MKVVIAGGREEADFLIGSLLSKKNKIKVINEDFSYSKYLSEKHNISVINGDPSKEYILEDADISNYDVLVALTNNDADNFVTCLTAKKRFDINKLVCTVANPSNVDVFKKLGITNVISSTYTLAKLLEQATTLESLVNTLSSDDDDVAISEIIVKEDTYLCGKKLKDVKLLEQSRITCVVRKGRMMIPTGQTVIQLDDKIVLLSAKECHEKVLELISGGEV